MGDNYGSQQLAELHRLLSTTSDPVKIQTMNAAIHHLELKMSCPDQLSLAASLDSSQNPGSPTAFSFGGSTSSRSSSASPFLSPSPQALSDSIPIGSALSPFSSPPPSTSTSLATPGLSSLSVVTPVQVPRPMSARPQSARRRSTPSLNVIPEEKWGLLHNGGGGPGGPLTQASPSSPRAPMLLLSAQAGNSPGPTAPDHPQHQHHNHNHNHHHPQQPVASPSAPFSTPGSFGSSVLSAAPSTAASPHSSSVALAPSSVGPSSSSRSSPAVAGRSLLLPGSSAAVGTGGGNPPGSSSSVPSSPLSPSHSIDVQAGLSTSAFKGARESESGYESAGGYESSESLSGRDAGSRLLIARKKKPRALSIGGLSNVIEEGGGGVVAGVGAGERSAAGDAVGDGGALPTLAENRATAGGDDEAARDQTTPERVGAAGGGGEEKDGEGAEKGGGDEHLPYSKHHHYPLGRHHPTVVVSRKSSNPHSALYPDNHKPQPQAYDFALLLPLSKYASTASSPRPDSVLPPRINGSSRERSDTPSSFSSSSNAFDKAAAQPSLSSLRCRFNISATSGEVPSGSAFHRWKEGPMPWISTGLFPQTLSLEVAALSDRSLRQRSFSSRDLSSAGLASSLPQSIGENCASVPSPSDYHPTSMLDVEVVHIQCMGVARMSVTFSDAFSRSAGGQDSGEGADDVAQLTKWDDEDGWETWTFKMKRGVGGRRMDINVWEGVGHFVVVRSIRILGETAPLEISGETKEEMQSPVATLTTTQQNYKSGGLAGRISNSISGTPIESKSPTRIPSKQRSKEGSGQERKGGGK